MSASPSSAYIGKLFRELLARLRNSAKISCLSESSCQHLIFQDRLVIGERVFFHGWTSRRDVTRLIAW